MLDYLFGFERSASIIPFQNYDHFASSQEKRNVYVLPLKEVDNAYVIVNWGTINSVKTIYPDMKFPDETSNPPAGWKTEKVIPSPQGDVIIYSVE